MKFSQPTAASVCVCLSLSTGAQPARSLLRDGSPLPATGNPTISASWARDIISHGSPCFQDHLTPPTLRTKCKPTLTALSISKRPGSWFPCRDLPGRQQARESAPFYNRGGRASAITWHIAAGQVRNPRLWFVHLLYPQCKQSPHKVITSHLERNLKGHEDTNHCGPEDKSRAPSGCKKTPVTYTVAS